MQFYTDSDIERWKLAASENEAFYELLPDKRKVSPMLLADLTIQMADRAYLSIAERNWPDALGYFRLVTKSRFLMLDRLLKGTQDRESIDRLEELREFGDATISLNAMALGGRFLQENCSRYLGHGLASKLHPNDIAFASFCLNGGKESPKVDCSNPEDILGFCLLIHNCDEPGLREALNRYLVSYERDLKQDAESTLCIACLPVIAFVRFVRENWISDFQIDHSLVPMELFDCKMNSDLELPVAFQAVRDLF